MEHIDPQANGSRTGDRRREEKPAPDPLIELQRYLQELQQYVAFYLAVRRDQVVASVRSIAVSAAMACLASLILLSLILAAAFVVLRGAAGGLAQALGGQLWLGQLIAGGGLLLLIALGAAFGTWYIKRKWYQARRRQYDGRMSAAEDSGAFASTYTGDGQPEKPAEESSPELRAHHHG